MTPRTTTTERSDLNGAHGSLSAATVDLDVAAEIRLEHERAQSAFRSALEHALRCGELLARVKAQLPHGQWSTWLDQNFPASARTASGYMRLHANRQRVADSDSVREALALLAAPTPAVLDDAALRRAQWEDTERDLRHMVVRGAWRDHFPIEVAYAACGIQLNKLEELGAHADYGYSTHEEYLAERLADIDNAFIGLIYELAAHEAHTQTAAVRP